MVDWAHKDDLLKQMRSRIKRQLRAAGYAEEKVEPLAFRGGVGDDADPLSCAAERAASHGVAGDRARGGIARDGAGGDWHGST